MTSYLPRELAHRLRVAMKQLPVVIVSGLRQAGKSTMLQNEPSLAKGHVYRTLDDFATLSTAQSNPESLLEGEVILDEVQRCPELLLALKRQVDENRVNGRFILSGSANLALLGKVSETLAGRAAYYTLYPMTRREQSGTNDEPFLVRFLKTPQLPAETSAPLTSREILRGGMPPACLNPLDDISEWFRGYIQTYVERDARQLGQIADLISFRTLTQFTAMRTGQVLVLSSLARDAKLNAGTAARYVDLLEASFLIRRVPPFLKNRSTRLIKSPKLYFTDSGLAAYFSGVGTLERLEEDPYLGALFETYVAQNLAAILEAHVPDGEMTYWHEQGRYEVDFVVENGRAVFAIEVKAATRWNDKDLAGLRAFLDRTPACAAAVLAHNGIQAAKLDDKLYAIPLGALLA